MKWFGMLPHKCWKGPDLVDSHLSHLFLGCCSSTDSITALSLCLECLIHDCCATALKAATDTAVANAVNLAAHQLVASTGLTAAAAAVVAQAASDAVDDDPASPAKNSALAKANGVSDFANTAFADAQAALVLELVGYTAAMAQIQVSAAESNTEHLTPHLFLSRHQPQRLA